MHWSFTPTVFLLARSNLQIEQKQKQTPQDNCNSKVEYNIKFSISNLIGHRVMFSQRELASEANREEAEQVPRFLQGGWWKERLHCMALEVFLKVPESSALLSCYPKISWGSPCLKREPSGVVLYEKHLEVLARPHNAWQSGLFGATAFLRKATAGLAVCLKVHKRSNELPLPGRSSTLPRCLMHHLQSCTCRRVQTTPAARLFWGKIKTWISDISHWTQMT